MIKVWSSITIQRQAMGRYADDHEMSTSIITPYLVVDRCLLIFVLSGPFSCIFSLIFSNQLHFKQDKKKGDKNKQAMLRGSASTPWAIFTKKVVQILLILC